MTKPLRCAIYTRKSSEEGLEQDFNSLHAQREASEAYILSQKHEGWQLVKAEYDDGGYSGGTMNRPGLQRLMQDIEAGKIDVVVVYKVDRLSRSLHDFAKMVEVFDRHKVSFVSVTQQFNTTTSMGRLTLNVLLSFAQFEREVTGERIRDKIAASKKKGMWMGGFAPIGYDIEEKKLIVNPAEAETVRMIFTRYLELRSVRLLCHDLQQRGIRSKSREHQSTMRPGGAYFLRGALYHLLRNPLYVGKIRFKDQLHDGLHEAIIDAELWDAVQQALADSREGTVARYHKTESNTLAGKLFDAVTGEKLAIVHASKQGKRYRYYISPSLKTGPRSQSPNGWRLQGKEIEQLISHAMLEMLHDADGIASSMQQAALPAHCFSSILTAAKALTPGIPDLLARFVHRIELQQDGITITLTLGSLIPADVGTNNDRIPMLTRCLPIRMQRRGIEMRLMIANQHSPAHVDTTLVKGIARARVWFEQLATGQINTIASLAAREGVDRSYATRILNLAFLAPDIVEQMIAGHQPAECTVENLTKRLDLPICWKQQQHLIDRM